MRKIGSKELKEMQLDILKDVHRFCIENSINYSLAYGTLLGAVRHSGYIPWDDDIDIMIPRKDYERFIFTYSNPIYKVIAVQTDKNYCLPFAKVHNINTILIEDVSIKNRYGVNIDVFPIEEMPENEDDIERIFKKKNILNSIYKFKLIRLGQGVSLYKRIIIKVVQLLLSPITCRKLVKSMENLVIKSSHSKSNKAGVFMPVDNKKRWIVNKELFYNTIDMKFETFSFKVVSEYDTYLRALYGEYKVLPPIEQQCTHHSFTAFYTN